MPEATVNESATMFRWGVVGRQHIVGIALCAVTQFVIVIVFAAAMVSDYDFGGYLVAPIAESPRDRENGSPEVVG